MESAGLEANSLTQLDPCDDLGPMAFEILREIPSTESLKWRLDS